MPTRSSSSLNHTAPALRWSAFIAMIPLGALFAMLVRNAGTDSLAFAWIPILAAANLITVILVLVLISRMETRFRREARTAAEALLTGRVSGLPALGRVIRCLPTGRTPSPAAPGHAPQPWLSVLEAALPNGPRRVMAFTPLLQKGNVVPLLIDPIEQETGILHPHPAPSGLIMPGRPRSDLQIGGGPGGLLAVCAAGLSLGFVIGFALLTLV